MAQSITHAVHFIAPRPGQPDSHCPPLKLLHQSHTRKEPAKAIRRRMGHARSPQCRPLGTPPQAAKTGSRSPVDRCYYGLLGVQPNASQQDIKTAYRRLALELHPDVSDEEDATERFAEVAAAYDVLSDADSRQLYDRYGPAGMQRHAGASAGRGNASRAWDEFKRTERKQSGRMRARAAAGDLASLEQGSEEAGAGLEGSSGTELPKAGDLVEYPLSDLVMADLQDGRTHGVGLLVGRNMDRGDAKTLPARVLTLCEVEPLRQEEPGSWQWIPDELAHSAFCSLHELTRVRVDAYDRRFDRWTCDPGGLSDGCGGPELPDEIMV